MDPLYLAQPIFTARSISPLSFEPHTLSTEDVLLPGCSDEDSPATRRRKKRRREEIGAQYLRQQAGYAITFRLKGPFEGGWRNPWAEYGVPLSEKELREMERKRARERAKEREREERQRGVRVSSPIDLTSDVEEGGSIQEVQVTRRYDSGGSKGHKHWLSSNVHRVWEGQQQSLYERRGSPTPEPRYKPQIGLQKPGKERYIARHSAQLSSQDSQGDEVDEDQDEEEDDASPEGHRSPSIELEYFSSQDRLPKGSDVGAISDLDLLDMRLPESRPRIERRVLRKRMIDVQNQLRSPHYKGSKQGLLFEMDILKARITALTTEISVLRDAEKLKAARTATSKKRGGDGAAVMVTDVSNHQTGRKKQKLFDENPGQMDSRPPALHAGSSEASTQNVQLSQEGQGMSKSARKRRRRREKRELEQLQKPLQIPREASEVAQMKSNRDQKWLIDAGAPPLTSPDSVTLSGQPKEVAPFKSYKNRDKALEVKNRPAVSLFSSKDKDIALTKKRKFELLPTTEQGATSNEDVAVRTVKPSKLEAGLEAKAPSRGHGLKDKAKQIFRESESPIAKEFEVSRRVMYGQENPSNWNGKKLPSIIVSDHDSPATSPRCILKSPTGWKPYKWLPGGQAYAKQVLRVHLESLELGTPLLHPPRRSSHASSQGSSPVEHERKRKKPEGSPRPQLKPKREGGGPSRFPGLMKLAQELDEKGRKNSVESVNTAWHKDHAGLFGKSSSKGSKAPTPVPEMLPSDSNGLLAAVSKSVEQIIDDALGLLPNAMESSQKDQVSGPSALSGKPQAVDAGRQSSAASKATNVSEVIDLETENEYEPVSATLKVTAKEKQPRVVRRMRSTPSEGFDVASKSEHVALMAPPPVSPTEPLPQLPQFRSFVPKALAEAVATDNQTNIKQLATKSSRKLRPNGATGSPHIAPSSNHHSQFQYSRLTTRSKTDSPATKQVTDKHELKTPKASKAPPKRRLSFTPGGNFKRSVEVRVPVVSHENLRALPSSQEGVQILQATSSPKQSTTTSSIAKPVGNEKSNSGGEVEVLPEAQAPAPLPSGPSTNILETDKQSLKFISTEDGDSTDPFNTQAELAKAQQSFQRDLQSPINNHTFQTSDKVAQSKLPGGDPAEGTTSLVTPRPALRSEKDPYAGGPHPDSDNQEPLSTQAMVDAMSPFAISTVKKPGTLLHALTRPAAAIFGYMGWGGSQPAGQKPPPEDPPRLEEEGVEAPIDFVPAPEPVPEPAINFGKSGLDMETSDDDADEFAYELSQPPEFVQRRKRGKLENVIPSEDVEESDFENTLKKQRGVRDDKGRWARVSPQLSEATPSRMTLRSFSSPHGKGEASVDIGQDGQRLTGLETVIDEAGSFLGTWDVEGEVRKIKASGSGSGAGTGGTRKSDGVRGGSG